MLKLENSLQNYNWGSRTFLSETYNFTNPHNLPMAELWIGTHPKTPSKVHYNNKISFLSDIINSNPQKLLGSSVYQYFGELPFLFKIICVENPLSIQVHPNKIFAKQGFLKENSRSIPINSYKRNYKDKNYKPELIYAITPFHALIGFKTFAQINSLLNIINEIHPSINIFLRMPNQNNLLKLLKYLLLLKGQEKLKAFNILKSKLKLFKEEPWHTIKTIIINYPEDNSLFLLLFFNNIFLKPGEAVFISCGTPHIYLKGNAIEISANSDNVLRAGLTSKYIDISEFLMNLKLSDSLLSKILIKPKKLQNELRFPIEILDFAFTIHVLTNELQNINQKSMAILFCIQGDFTIIKDDRLLLLKSGESCFVSAEEMPIKIKGNGSLARVFNELY
ncbi:mannose-6-phosphate isomerase, class I [Candidatus Pantoea edessiphila]|uniref:mannose-6-phosphate isomerase n=1 Tax=Candidatus Pantoea edessiphila TaxID=2044610 RepID=A0A2P5T346_9GAMM|nr:mannose-6-phosphate isomerase, class I [Candidatus Pantoea edessiphila]PPI88973.1 mannose-6-phosphate isomerase, class I [Candidatus Pantoea edessiphila]